MREVAFTLEDLASTLTAQGRYARAATLFAGAERLRADLGIPPSPSTRDRQERDRVSLQAELAPDTLTAARAEGAAMTEEQVVAFALNLPTR